jgi:pimeloyl-ACP methyl ester carboxylesterase
MMNDSVNPIVATSIETCTLLELATFRARYPLRSLEIAGRSWVFRATRRRAAEQVPVLMLPGIQGGGDIFFEVALALGDLIPLVMLSAPDIEDMAEMDSAMAHLLDALDITRVNLVGSSLGAYLAQSFALSFPDLVDQLVIANGFVDVGPFVSKLPPASTFSKMDAATLVEQNLRPLLESPSCDEGQVRLKAAVKALVGSAQTLENYKSRLLLMMSAPPLAAPPISPERVMIIDDDHDPILPAPMRDAVRERFARSEQHTIDGGGHLPAIQRPAIFADLLRRRFIGDAS